MIVKVSASGWAKKILPMGEINVSGENLTAIEAAKLAGFSENDIGILVVDGKRIDENEILHDRAELKVLPTIIGG